jgi:hypothetical protein
MLLVAEESWSRPHNEIDVGEYLWLFTRLKAPLRFYFVARLVVWSKTINLPGEKERWSCRFGEGGGLPLVGSLLLFKQVSQALDLSFLFGDAAL